MLFSRSRSRARFFSSDRLNVRCQSWRPVLARMTEPMSVRREFIFKGFSCSNTDEIQLLRSNSKTPHPTTMSNPTRLELVHSYRHMYRALLRAVQYSKPARYTARDQLRDGYRNRKRHNFDRNKIERTIEFLNGAARETGLEHRILRNLISTRFHLAYR